MRMSKMLEPKRYKIKSLQSSIIMPIYLKLKLFSVSVSRTSLDTRYKERPKSIHRTVVNLCQFHCHICICGTFFIHKKRWEIKTLKTVRNVIQVKQETHQEMRQRMRTFFTTTSYMYYKALRSPQTA